MRALLELPVSCCPNPCWASSEILGVMFLTGIREKAPSTRPWTDSTPPAGVPSCCYCCCRSASDRLSELSQAWIIGSWNQLKHEPAEEGSCFSLNCPLTEEKHSWWSTAAIQTGALASRATHSFETASVFVSNWFCEALLAPEYLRGSTKAGWGLAGRMCLALHLSLS